LVMSWRSQKKSELWDGDTGWWKGSLVLEREEGTQVSRRVEREKEDNRAD